jgi:steroid 5-alpha reductase family enzyme
MWLGVLPVLLVAALVGWLVSLAVKSVNLVGALWCLMLFAAGVTYALDSDPRSPRLSLVLWLLALWAARLAVYLVTRSAGKGEERRYGDLRVRHEPGFAFKSLYLVFVPQALLAWVISLPLMGAFASIQPTGLLDQAGLALWGIGSCSSHSPTGNWRDSGATPPTPMPSWTAACGVSRATLTTSARPASGGDSGSSPFRPAPGGPCPARSS